jgi:selenium metabolism protein YedF
MRVVDTKGQLCPAPLIATKRALKETPVGESFIVLTDNKTSFDNVSRFLKDNNTGFQVSESGGVWKLTITRTSGKLVNPNAEEYCIVPVSHFEKGNFIIVISSDKMGEGDDELGLLLMTNFIKAIKDMDKLPQKIILYNKGVTLAANYSPHIEHLMDLEKMGVELLLCATCVSHYKIESFVETGILSNMFVIAESMASAGNIVKP